MGIITRFAILILFVVSCASELDPLDPNANITVKWDVMSWTPDGYVAVVTIFNYQKYRHIQPPGWSLTWDWNATEIIWSMLGGEATEQGDCSNFTGNIPHCCKSSPTIVDLMPGAPYNQQVANCCKGGVISSLVQDPDNAASSFQLSVGQAGTSIANVTIPINFRLLTPGPGYVCSNAKRVKPPSRFMTPDKRRATQALMTWNATCTYSQIRAPKPQTCCVSLSSFYDDTIVPCPTCSCGCRSTSERSGSCVDPNTPDLASVVLNSGKNSLAPALVQCTNHMCPIRVHWHIKLNYKLYWRVKITITNFNYNMNYSHWNLVAQHPNFENLTTIFSFNYAPLIPVNAAINDSAMLWGVKFYNDLLMQAGPYGNVQTELLFQKDPASFTFENGWGFPTKIYFNGDNCVMPPPVDYPSLPNAGSRHVMSAVVLATALFAALLFFYCQP